MQKASDQALPNSPARERILLAAHRLFYRDGIRATGIDKIIAESGVAKVTFYRHFPSKNDLILAFLDYRHQLWIAWFKDAFQRPNLNTKGIKLLPEVMEKWFTDPMFRGCAFINCMAELGDTVPTVTALCRQHKQEMATVIADLLPPNPNRLETAQAIAIAVDGAIIRAQLYSADGQDDNGKATAGLKLIIDALSGQPDTQNSRKTYA